MPHTAFFISLILPCFIFSCQEKAARPQSPRPVIFISEPLPNRADGKTLIDSNCTGFFKRHFDPRGLSAEHFTAEDLKRQTGLNWKASESRDSVIEFHRMFSDIKNKVVYVAEIIASERAEKRVMSIGSDDGFSLWVNGDSVASVHKGRSIEPNADLILVQLRQGKNVVLYKVDQGDENWGLYRRLLSNADLNAVLRMKAGELYSDMAESCIVPDTATMLPLRSDARRRVDSLHRVSLRWKSLMSTEPVNKATLQDSSRSSAEMIQPVATSLRYLSWQAWGLPREIKLPKNFNGLAVLETTVSDENGHECYREDVPVFDAKTALVLAKELTNVTQPQKIAASKKGDPMLVARRAAVVELFALKPDTLVKTYSTRMKAQALADLYRYTRSSPAALSSFSGPQVWGYRNAKDSVCMFRVFVPARLREAKQDSQINSAGGGRGYPVVFLMYGSAASHTYMARRAVRSTEYQSIIVMQNLNEVENFLSDASTKQGNTNAEKANAEEFHRMLEKLKANFPIDTARISIAAVSKAGLLMLQTLQENALPVSRVGMISTVMFDDAAAMETILSEVKQKNPNMKWFIRHGLNDNDIPLHLIRKWVEKLGQATFEVSYEEVPHSSHWNFLTDFESEFLWFVTE